MVTKTYLCDVCGLLSEDPISLAEHEKIPVTGEGYHGLLLKEPSPLDHVLYVLFRETYQEQEINHKHETIYDCTYLYFDCKENLIPASDTHEHTAGGIDHMLFEGMYEHFTEKDFERISQKVKPWARGVNLKRVV